MEINQHKGAESMYKTKPYDYQREIVENHQNRFFQFLALEPGLGKSKISLDIAANLYRDRRIEAILIIAPKGIHTNFGEREVDAHLSVENHRVAIWRSPLRKQDEEAINATMEPGYKGLRILAINIDSVNTKKGYTLIEYFLKTYSTLIILDESTRIKSPKAQRTKKLLKLAPHAKYRLALSGTPLLNSPFDLWSQYKFLSPTILEYPSYTTFTNMYGIFEEKINLGTGRRYRLVKSYKNLEDLQKRIAPHTVRLKKEEALDLPDKVWTTIQVDLESKQARAYLEMKKTLLTEINGKEITAPLAITKMLRLSQITGGYLEDMELGRSKLEMLKTILEDLPPEKKVVIWARFRSELKGIYEEVEKLYPGEARLYFGDTSQEERREIVEEFQDKSSKTRFFIGNATTAGMGITLTASDTVIYYSLDFSAENFIQSQDRTHRISQNNHVNYTILEAKGTIDGYVRKALMKKKDMASSIIDNLKSILL